MNLISDLSSDHSSIDVSSMQNTDNAAMVIGQVVSLLTKQSEAIVKVLTKHLYFKFNGLLLTSIHNKLIYSVFQLTDIAVEESERLFAVLSLLFPLEHQLFDLDLHVVNLGADLNDDIGADLKVDIRDRSVDMHRVSHEVIGTDSANRVSVDEIVQWYCPLKPKYHETVLILNMNLTEIMENFMQGRRSSSTKGACFKAWTHKELSRIVCALFSDTSNRQRALALFEQESQNNELQSVDGDQQETLEGQDLISLTKNVSGLLMNKFKNTHQPT